MTDTERFQIITESRTPIHDEGDVLRVRLIGRTAAERAGFDDIRGAGLEIAISELGMNLVKHHGVRGVLTIRVVDAGTALGVEVLSEDQGPGISDQLHALEDGFSTAGSLGIGLPSIRRLMDEFQMEQAQPRGTRILVRKWQCRRTASRLSFSVFNRPKLGEKLSGDLYFLKHHPNYAMFGIVDALGHGPEAYAVARRALLHLERCFDQPLADIFTGCHMALLGTRGAAMALARVDHSSLRMEYLSIGNVETRCYTPGGEIVRLTNRFGTLGLGYALPEPKKMNLSPRSALIMFSDGIHGNLSLPREMLQRKEQEIALHIFEHFRKKYDDATVIVAKVG